MRFAILLAYQVLASVLVFPWDASGQRPIPVDQVPLFTASEELRIGDRYDASAGFSRIGEVAVDRLGNIYVMDLAIPEVRVFDRTGNKVAAFGGSGEGPGEFDKPSGMGLRGDTLWVYDSQFNRVTMFSLDGEVLTTFPGGGRHSFEAPPGVLATSYAGVLREDGLVHMEQPVAIATFRTSRNPSTTPPDSISVPILRTSRTGMIVDTIASAILYPVALDDEGSPNRPPQTDMVLDPGPPADTPLRIRSNSGLTVVARDVADADTLSSFSVIRLHSVGDTAYETSFVYRPRVFSSSFVRQLKESRGDIEIPPVQSPVSAGEVGSEGVLWLRREADRRPHEWLILSPEGVPLGRVELPVNSSIRWVGRNVVYTVEKDELDIPWLVRYRIG